MFGDQLSLVAQHLHMCTTSWLALGAGSGPSVRSAESSTPLRTPGPRDSHDMQQALLVQTGLLRRTSLRFRVTIC